MTLRDTVGRWVDKPWVSNLILGVILFDALLMGLETSKVVMAEAGALIRFLDHACLAVFLAELAAKLLSQGRRFFVSGWNLFDLAVVAIALAPATQGLSVLRALRVMRVLAHHLDLCLAPPRGRGVRARPCRAWLRSLC